jgi:hypothetical protein
MFKKLTCKTHFGYSKPPKPTDALKTKKIESDKFLENLKNFKIETS